MWGGRAALCVTLGAEATVGNQTDALDAGFVWTLLPRHGRRPARFLGRQMLRADNHAASPGRLRLWSDIQISELYGGGFVVSVRHMRREDDSAFYQDVWLARDAAGVILSLRQHDITTALPDEPYACGTASACAWRALVGVIFGEEQA